MPLPENNLLFGFAPKLTVEQLEYVNAIFDNQLVMVDAKAGTGKPPWQWLALRFFVNRLPIFLIRSKNP